MKNTETGKKGEKIAYDYLRNKGYLILAKNHREGFHEIDIIARQSNGILIFCEVKTLNDKGGYSMQFVPEDNLTPMKLKKMIQATRVFLGRHPEAVYENKGWQIDLIAVVIKDGELSRLRHYENL
jgi:putative endonuclease